MEKFSIEHTLKLEGKTISGKITNVNWGKYKRGQDCIGESMIDLGFYHICSMDRPELSKNTLFLLGRADSEDDFAISYTYKTKKEAKAMYGFIMKYTKKMPKIEVMQERTIKYADSYTTYSKKYITTEEGKYTLEEFQKKNKKDRMELNRYKKFLSNNILSVLIEFNKLTLKERFKIFLFGKM